MHTYKRIQKKSIGTTPISIEENPKRVGILIQNLSANTLYIMGYQQTDVNQSIELAPNDNYRDPKGASSALSIVASGAASNIRIEESISV